MSRLMAPFLTLVVACSLLPEGADISFSFVDVQCEVSP